MISLRARRLSVTEIARILTADGTPVSAQTEWKICAAEGLPRLRGDDAASRGPATQLAPVRAAALPGWPAEPMDLPCDHAGLLLLAPAMTELHLHELIAGCGYPATSRLSAWQSVGTLLLATATGVPRTHHIDKITDDAGLAFFLGSDQRREELFRRAAATTAELRHLLLTVSAPFDYAGSRIATVRLAPSCIFYWTLAAAHGMPRWMNGAQK